MDEQPTRSRGHRLPATVIVRMAAVVALAGVLVLAYPASAGAHAIVQSTEPGIDEVVEASPGQVAMTFNEPVEIAFGAIRVFDTRGRRVDAGDAAHLPGRPDSIRVPLRPDLPDGTYTVTWRVVSADGHPIEEAFVFHVGAPGQNPLGIADQILAGQAGAGPLEGLLLGVARWLNFAALLVLVGAAFFLVAVWWSRQTGPVRSARTEAGFLRRWSRVVTWSWIAAVVATVALYVLQGAAAADVPLAQALSGDVVTEMASTRFGIVSLAKLGVLVAAAALWVVARRPFRPGLAESVGAATARPSLPVWMVAAGGAMAALLVASPGVAGHAGTTPPLLANIPADALHVFAAAAWLGGLLILLVAAFPAVRGLGAHDRVATLAPVVTRYSDMAVLAIALLVASGLFRTWTEVRALRAFTGATYGIVLLVKLGTFLPILAMGLINNRWTKPRIARAAEEGTPGKAPLRTLRRLVALEVVLVAVVVAITAFLVNLPPARVDAGVTGPFITDVRLGQNNLNVLVDPNQVGENEVHLTATQPSGAPLPVRESRVLFRMPEEGIGPLVGRGTELSEGHFVVQGHQLSVPGEWQLEIVMRMSRFDEERVTVTVTVNP